MEEERQLGESSDRFQRLRRLFALNIRGKIVLPYLLLTLVVAVIGIYVVMEFVTQSIDDRLNNFLFEAGRAVSNSMAYQEVEHLESARQVAFTRGVAEALREGDIETLLELGEPAVGGAGLEFFVLSDAEGVEVLHTLRGDDGTISTETDEPAPSALWVVHDLVANGDPDALPRRGMGQHPSDERYYYVTAIPVALDGEMIGVAVVGTSLDTLMPVLKNASLAEVTMFFNGGQSIASTFFPGDTPAAGGRLDNLSISVDDYDTYLRDVERTIVENVIINASRYRLAYEQLKVSNDVFGVFSVSLPSNYVVEAGAVSRNVYLLVFAVAMAAVIFVGYIISQRITSPIGRLVRTSQAVAEGDLDQRTGIGTSDEVGVLAQTFDIMTGRLADRTHALEESLRAQQEATGRLRAILSSIGDGVILEDPNSGFIALNATAEAVLEEMASDFLLGPLLELSAADEEAVDFEGELNPWLVDSRRFQVGNSVLSTHTAAVRTDDGEHLGTVLVLRDVTVEVEAERLKDSFIAHVSHELRTPLTAIRGYTGLMLSGAGGTLDDAQREFIETINRHTDSLISMVNELLDFSEMEAGRRLGLRRQPTSLPEMVEGVAEEWRPQMEEKGIAFVVEADQELPEANVDDRRLRWALINLVRNAWQYTPTDGEVKLRLSLQDGKALFEVEDTGIGIPPKDQARIFDRFHRVTIGSSESDEVRGLGLGLYLSKAIIEAHGGEISVSSEEGTGSTFRMVMPIE
jgi:two-component system sensor histidine kinase VicK